MQVAGTTADGVYVYQVLPCLVSGPQKAGRQYRGGITGFLYCVVFSCTSEPSKHITPILMELWPGPISLHHDRSTSRLPLANSLTTYTMCVC